MKPAAISIFCNHYFIFCAPNKSTELNFLGQERSKEPFGLRVKLSPVYYTRWRIHTAGLKAIFMFLVWYDWEWNRSLSFQSQTLYSAVVTTLPLAMTSGFDAISLKFDSFFGCKFCRHESTDVEANARLHGNACPSRNNSHTQFCRKCQH